MVPEMTVLEHACIRYPSFGNLFNRCHLCLGAHSSDALAKLIPERTQLEVCSLSEGMLWLTTS